MHLIPFDENCCEVPFANIKFPFFDTNNISMRLWIVNDDIWYHEDGILIVQFEIVKSSTKISDTIISDQMKWQILKNISFGSSGYTLTHTEQWFCIQSSFVRLLPDAENRNLLGKNRYIFNILVSCKDYPTQTSPSYCKQPEPSVNTIINWWVSLYFLEAYSSKFK